MKFMISVFVVVFCFTVFKGYVNRDRTPPVVIEQPVDNR